MNDTEKEEVWPKKYLASLLENWPPNCMILVFDIIAYAYKKEQKISLYLFNLDFRLRS